MAAGIGSSLRIAICSSPAGRATRRSSRSFRSCCGGLHAVGVGYLTAGLVISNLAFLAALVAYEQLTRELLDAKLARRATVYLALFPIGYVCSMSHPESLVLLAIPLAALAALNHRWLIAAAILATGTLARPETLFLALPLLPLFAGRHANAAQPSEPCSHRLPRSRVLPSTSA
jgi:hypothetical protein